MENETAAAHKVAAQVTQKSASNLWFVSRALSRNKQKLFQSSYATMRIIDDFVDDDFLPRAEPDRVAERANAHKRIENWVKNVTAACAGESYSRSDNERDGQLFLALRDAAGNCDIVADPWIHLAKSMRDDVDEIALQTWADFYAYCEGATVAPAAVFLYVLQAREHIEAGATVLKAEMQSNQLMDQARDMAVFCYLVHILRDYAKDAARGGQLLTIPTECFAAHGLSRETASDKLEIMSPLLTEIAERATGHRVAAREMADRLMPSLPRVEAGILDSLLAIYEGLHDSLSSNVTQDRTGLTDRLRRSLAVRLGV